MMMRTIRLLLSPPLLVLLLLGCSSGGSSSEPAQPKIDPATKGLDILGRGTDVFGSYAVESNVKGQVLDVNALNIAGLLVFNPSVQEYKYEAMSGNTISTYASALSGSVGLSGSYMFFSAEMKVAFGNESYRQDTFSYASIMERQWKHSLRVEPGIWSSRDHLRPYLTTFARQAIDNADPVHGPWSGEQVIAAYGTHVMNGIYVGARLDYHLAIQIMDESNRSSLSAFVKAKYGKGFTSAEITSDISEETYNAMNMYQQVGPVISAKGGSSQYAHPEDDAQYQLWKASIDSNPVFCGIINGGLLGIWELAETPARRAELLAAYEAYAAAAGADFVPVVGRITDLMVLDVGPGTGEPGEHTRPTVTQPQGYELLKSASGDIWKGNLNGDLWHYREHANYVYLALQSQVTDEPVGIAALHLASTDAAVDAALYGAPGHVGYYGSGRQGCTDPDVATKDINAGTTHHVVNFHGWMWCAYNVVGVDSYVDPGSPLFLHYTMEPELSEPARCIVVGDSVAIDGTKPLEERAQHIFWAPWDVNHDGPAGDPLVDGKWVVSHTYWVTAPTSTDNKPVNVNLGTESWALYDQICGPWAWCWTDGCRWHNGFDNGFEAAGDAQYLGVCYLNPPP